MELSRDQIRTLIYYEWKKGLNPPSITKEMNSILGSNTVSERTCRNWVNKFNEGVFSTKDEDRSGRPMCDIDEQILSTLNENPRTTATLMADTLGVDKSTVTLHLKNLGYKYRTCKYVPHKLSPENKLCRVRVCNELIEKNNRYNFLNQLITEDEIWIQWDCEGSFSQRKCWAGGDTTSKAVNVRKSLTPRKSLAIFFWDSRGVIF